MRERKIEKIKRRRFQTKEYVAGVRSLTKHGHEVLKKVPEAPHDGSFVRFWPVIVFFPASVFFL